MLPVDFKKIVRVSKMININSRTLSKKINKKSSKTIRLSGLVKEEIDHFDDIPFTCPRIDKNSISWHVGKILSVGQKGICTSEDLSFFFPNFPKTQGSEPYFCVSEKNVSNALLPDLILGCYLIEMKYREDTGCKNGFGNPSPTYRLISILKSIDRKNAEELSQYQRMIRAKQKKKFLIFLILLVSGLLFLMYFCLNSNKVTYYGYLKSSSTSGETKFYWYDTELKKIKSPKDKYTWFWAMPPTVPEDETMTDKWVDFIDSNREEVFKIAGKKLKNDCEYYGPEHCIEDINIKTIEVVGTNEKIEFIF